MMNERIEKLAEQANAWYPDGYPSSEGGDAAWKNLVIFEKADLEKFTELIVRECAQVCLAQRDPANLNYKPSEKFAEAVKQHFGVDK